MQKLRTSTPARSLNIHTCQFILNKHFFTHIIQLWHHGSASTHLKLKQVEYFLRVAQWLQDVHVAPGVQLFSNRVETWRDVSHQSDPSLGFRGSRSSSAMNRIRLLSQHASDRLTPPIGWRVMGLALAVQWAATASGVTSRLSGLSGKRALWLVRYLSERAATPASSVVLILCGCDHQSAHYLRQGVVMESNSCFCY